MKSAIEWYKNTELKPMPMFVTIHPSGYFYLNAELMRKMGSPKFVKVGFDLIRDSVVIANFDEWKPHSFEVRKYEVSSGGYIHSKHLINRLSMDSSWTATKTRCPAREIDDDIFVVEIPEED